MNALQKLIGSFTAAAGQQALQTPEMQAAIRAAQQEAAYYGTLAKIAGVAGALVFLFYFLPRFESPIPRHMRRLF